MSPSIQNILNTFDHLPDADKQVIAAEILRRTLNYQLPPLSDDELVLQAEELFLELDRREAEDGQS
jgi:hypothetical protein